MEGQKDLKEREKKLRSEKESTVTLSFAVYKKLLHF